MSKIFKTCSHLLSTFKNILPIESVVILNIPYWGAGVQPWNLGSAHKDFPHAPSISDQKLEVFCVYSSFHIAQMQVI